eukprot:gene20107-26828_t
MTVHGALCHQPKPRSNSPPEDNCDNPKLGSLCGSDAIGAIIGIAVGGLLLLTLLVCSIWCFVVRRSSSEQVMDEYMWATNYANAMNVAAAELYAPKQAQAPAQAAVDANSAELVHGQPNLGQTNLGLPMKAPARAAVYHTQAKLSLCMASLT